MPIIAAHDYHRVLQWLKNNYSDDYPNMSFIRVTNIYVANQKLTNGTKQPRVTIIVSCNTKRSYLGMCNITWYDKSPGAPDYARSLDAFWDKICEYFWEDRLAFDDLGDMARNRQKLPLADQLYNAIHTAIKTAIEIGQMEADLNPIFNRFYLQADSIGPEVADDLQNQFEAMKQSLESNGLPAVDNKVQLSLTE